MKIWQIVTSLVLAGVTYANPELVLFVALVGVMFSPLVALIIYRLAHIDIFCTMVPQGEIIVVMHADKVHRYIGNIAKHWVDPQTGEVHEDTVPKSGEMPRNLWGIYWLGFWPYASRYTYRFPRAKYVKEPGEGIEYAIIGRDDTADSVFWQASYGIEVKMAETKEGVPITAEFVITTKTINAGTALFANKSPGWLDRVTAAVNAEIRDFIGNKNLTEINEMRAENGDKGGKSELQEEIELLNKTTHGNPGLIETTGEEIIAINFLGYRIETTGLNKAQEASVTKYYAERDAEKVRTQAKVDAEKVVIEAQASLDAAGKEAQKIELLGKAKATAIRAEGSAKAEAAKSMSDAVRDNPHATGMAMAENIGKLTGLRSAVFGASIMPTMNIEASPDGKEKPAPEAKKEGGR